MKTLLAGFVLAALISPGIAFQGDRGQSHITSKGAAAPRDNDARPVTEAELAAVMQKVDAAVQRTVLRSSKPIPKSKGSTAPAKTSSIVLAFDKTFRLCEPKFKLTPRMMVLDRKVLTIKPGSPARAPLENLIRWGCVGRVSPLATSPSQTLTPAQFGDALGLCLARLAELTHTPSSKWSPYMNWHLDPSVDRPGKKPKTGN